MSTAWKTWNKPTIYCELFKKHRLKRGILYLEFMSWINAPWILRYTPQENSDSLDLKMGSETKVSKKLPGDAVNRPHLEQDSK